MCQETNLPSSEERTVEELEKKVKVLQQKCECLEAQNILVSVQQLDILARAVAVILSALTFCSYVFMVLWSWERSGISAILKDCFAAIDLPVLLEPWTSTLCIWSIKTLPLSLPYIHHRFSHGLAHRRFEVFAVFFIVLARMKLCRWRERMFASDDQDKDTASYGIHASETGIWEANYAISARFLYVSILRLQGLWTKTAQYLSSRADFMPKAYITELAKLQDSAPQTPNAASLIPKRIRDQLVGFDDEAIASASIGQVHTARLKGGERVVVKIQHPRARPLMLDDFWSLHIFCRIIRWLEPEYGFIEKLMREWASESRKELDFLQEGRNLEDALKSIDQMYAHHEKATSKQAFLTNPNDQNERLSFDVEIPQPYMKLSNRNILIMSFSEGTRIDDKKSMAQWDLPLVFVMDAMAQTFAHMMYIQGPFNGDPHPGNALVRKGIKDDPASGFTIVLLDWGLAKRLDLQQRTAFCQMVYAASTIDFGLMLDSFQTLGLKMKRENVAEDMEGVRFVLRDMAPSELSRKRIKAKIKTDVGRVKSKKKGEKIPMESKAYPGEFFFFIRVNELLHGLGSKFGISLSYLDVLKPYAERGLLVHPVDVEESKCAIGNDVDGDLSDKVLHTINDLDEQGQIAGAQVCMVNSNGQVVVDVAAGHQGGLKKKLPMSVDTLVLGFSCTKATAATLAHVMVEQGYLSYDEPVCERVWVDFCPSESPPEGLELALDLTMDKCNERWSFKRTITLRHILYHSAGLWEALPSRLTVKSMVSCEDCYRAFEYDASHLEQTLLPSKCPGSTFEYHFMSFGWLVAGTLVGAYRLKHKLEDVTYATVYESLLKCKLQNVGAEAFRPCGGVQDSSFAFTDTGDSMSIHKLQQLGREADAMGEDNPFNGLSDETLNSFRGKEFLLDSRVWNCHLGLNTNCPSAGGRFSARGLARFYHELGCGNILEASTLKEATDSHTSHVLTSSLQGQTDLTSDNQETTTKTSMGMGFQLIALEGDKEPSAFGHAGVGGSVGFYHKPSGMAVAVMLNKADAEKSTASRIVGALADALRSEETV